MRSLQTVSSSCNANDNQYMENFELEDSDYQLTLIRRTHFFPSFVHKCSGAWMNESKRERYRSSSYLTICITQVEGYKTDAKKQMK